tara:strand:- start:151 stop:879 length:729 start_codon:yes stop_codon:yes gene_type:complete
MAGHSKWANIKHKKAAADAKRGKVFTKIIREITVAAKMGGGDLSSNSRLRLACEKALSSNMPKDNIDRAIKKGSGANDSSTFENIIYEGYGLDGVAVMINCLTDNKIRTVADIRHIFSKNGGNLGTSGSVSHLFEHCGLMLIDKTTSEDDLIELTLNFDILNIIKVDNNNLELTCRPDTSFYDVKKSLKDAAVEILFSDIIYRPILTVDLKKDSEEKLIAMLDAFENHDDVQDVTSNANLSE